MDESKDKACHHTLPKVYQPRHPESTVLYKVFQVYLETWITSTVKRSSFTGSSLKEDGIAFALKDYLELADWTGRIVRDVL